MVRFICVLFVVTFILHIKRWKAIYSVKKMNLWTTRFNPQHIKASKIIDLFPVKYIIKTSVWFVRISIFKFMSIMMFMSSKKNVCTYFKVPPLQISPKPPSWFLLGLLTNLIIYLIFFFILSDHGSGTEAWFVLLCLILLIVIILSTHLLSAQRKLYMLFLFNYIIVVLPFLFIIIRLCSLLILLPTLIHCQTRVTTTSNLPTSPSTL